MNYIKESRSFREWIYRNSPSMGQITLWYALFDLCNQSGWKEWFNAANNTLMLGSGLSRPGIVKCREFLKEHGLIDFKTYGPNKAADYRMIPFTSQKVDIEVDIPVDNSEVTSQKVDIPVANELAFQYRIPKQDLLNITTTDYIKGPESEIEHYFIQKRRRGLNVGSDDHKAMIELVADGIPVEFIKSVLDKIFADFKPKYKTHAIMNFTYCVPRIYEEWHLKTEKEKVGEPNAKYGGRTERIRSGGNAPSNPSRHEGESKSYASIWDDELPVSKVSG